jgi:hypothetical protein
MNTKFLSRLTHLSRAGLATAGLIAASAVIWTGQAVIGPPSPEGAPDELIIPLKVQAAYNGERIFFRYRWPAPEPHIHHDMLRFDGSDWERINAGDTDAPIGEDRLSMMIDDGNVPDFAHYGGYILIGPGIRFMPGAAGPDAVESHPYLGNEHGLDDIRKYLPQTRTQQSWDTVREQESLLAQRQAGYFLDMWKWRGHRGNPVGAGDDLFVADHRYGDPGSPSYSTNVNPETQLPRYMFNPEQTGRRAFRWIEIAEGSIGPDDIHALTPDVAIPFDPDHEWQEGETLPRRFLHSPEGSRGTVSAEGNWKDGYWELVLTRDMDTGNPLEDKAFQSGGLYNVAFAVHLGGTAGRHHHVSFPFTVGLDREADLTVQHFPGENPDWSQHEGVDVTLFYPGQVTWTRITGYGHAGAEAVEQGVPMDVYHHERKLALYGVEAEDEDRVRRSWFVAIISGLVIISFFGLTIHRVFKQEDGS